MTSQPEPAREQASRAPRLPTGHPDRFLIPRDQLPPGFAARVEAPLEGAAEPRAAATVVLVRERADGMETLLLRRPSRSSFAADAWVFPGGAVDAADRAVDLERLASGPGPGWWARRLGVEDEREATGYVVAALREAWEETGILLADGAAAPPREARAALLDGTRSLGEILAREGVRLATDDLLYLAHWVTPEPEPRRYDTRFFLARVPPGTECELFGAELAEARWLAPGHAVAAWESGTLRLLPPTAHTLRRLADFGSLDAAWDALRDAPVPAIRPRMRTHPDGVMIEL